MTTTANTAEANPTIFAVVLAAGQSTRFGASKQLATIDGAPLIRRALKVAAEACGEYVLTVLGHDAATVYRAMQTNSGFLVVNEGFEGGLGTSIAVAACACPPETDALLLLLADQALVTAEHLEALMSAWSGAPNEIVATSYADIEGPPVLMPRETFADLSRLDGDAGARLLFRDKRFRLKTVCFEDAAIDIDTGDDLAELLKRRPPWRG
ncbi:MAG: nucleotidyltransferase family protein [Woeseiaceae bacterium]